MRQARFDRMGNWRSYRRATRTMGYTTSQPASQTVNQSVNRPVSQTVSRRMKLFLSAVLLGSFSGVLSGPLPVLAQRTTVFDLNQAICANDWDEAIAIVGMIVADDRTASFERGRLLTMRRQLEQFRSENILVADAQACNRTDPYFIDAALPPSPQTGQPLGWDRAIAEATDNQYSTEVITEGLDLTLPIAAGGAAAGLADAVPVDMSQGLSVVSGHVGPGHEVYGFVAGMGDRVDINLEVTRIMAGSLYTSDDSQLFIFDRQGNLIAAADDSAASEQSRISGLMVPRTDVYFAVVTSYNNDPILDREGRLTGWQDNGGGRFDYTLSLSGITPTAELMRQAPSQ